MKIDGMFPNASSHSLFMYVHCDSIHTFMIIRIVVSLSEKNVRKIHAYVFYRWIWACLNL